MLLPIQAGAAREISLAQHLAWVACKGKAGSAYLINELVRFVYLTYYGQDAGYGDTDVVVYACQRRPKPDPPSKVSPK
jgi:hypothetical protein